MEKKSVIGASAFAVLLALCLLPGMAQAADVTVGCPGGSGGTYPSINAALAAIGQIGPSSITVTGTCNENVFLFSARSLTFIAGPGPAVVVGPQDFDTFDIFLSQDITLVGLEIVGTPGSSVNTAGAGVFVSDASEVHLNRCNIHDNQGGGVIADTNSLVFLRRSTIQNNTPNDGLDATDNSSVDVFFTTIQNNGAGVFVDGRSSVIFRQRNFILSNGDFGIFAQALSNVRFQTALPDRFTTIQGHNVNGILMRKESNLQINSPSVVTGNGGACPLDPTCGGIFASRGSSVTLNVGTISGNHGSGIDVQEGTSVALVNATISNNSGDGVRVERISTGNFASGNSITGNGGASVFCDERSLVFGDLKGFSKFRCEEIERPRKQRHDDEALENKERDQDQNPNRSRNRNR